MCIELHKKFDVAEVTTEVADKLRKHEIVIRGITAKAVFEIGGELKAAHDELSNYHGGVFVAWCDSIGYNPMRAKRYMDYHDFVLTNCENRELIESLPKSLVYEAGKKSAPAELTQKVLDGEITTHKQWQEEMKAMKERTEQAEARTRAAEEANKVLTEQYNAQAQELQDIKDNPQVIVKDSDQTTSEIWNLRGENKQLQDKITELENQAYDSSSKDYIIQNLEKKVRGLEQELEEEKAHKQGLTLQEYIVEKDERTEKFNHLLKTKQEEDAAAKVLRDFFYKTNLLPDSPIEMRESLRCYLEDGLDKNEELASLQDAIIKAETRINILKEAIGVYSKPRLEVVKK